jgi:hypothetical protein
MTAREQQQPELKFARKEISVRLNFLGRIEKTEAPKALGIHNYLFRREVARYRRSNDEFKRVYDDGNPGQWSISVEAFQHFVKLHYPLAEVVITCI